MYSGGMDSFDAKENWLFATYGQGVLDAARARTAAALPADPPTARIARAGHRGDFRPVIAQPNVDFNFSFKYAQAHALSSTTQTFHRGYIESLGNLKTLWTMRNDDALMLRWAAPGFRARVRRRTFRTRSRRATTSARTCGSGAANS